MDHSQPPFPPFPTILHFFWERTSPTHTHTHKHTHTHTHTHTYTYSDESLPPRVAKTHLMTYLAGILSWVCASHDLPCRYLAPYEAPSKRLIWRKKLGIYKDEESFASPPSFIIRVIAAILIHCITYEWAMSLKNEYSDLQCMKESCHDSSYMSFNTSCHDSLKHMSKLTCTPYLICTQHDSRLAHRPRLIRARRTGLDTEVHVHDKAKVILTIKTLRISMFHCHKDWNVSQRLSFTHSPPHCFF